MVLILFAVIKALYVKYVKFYHLTLTPFNVCFMIDYISKDKHIGAMDINSLNFLVEQYLQQTNKVFGDSLRVTDQRC